MKLTYCKLYGQNEWYGGCTLCVLIHHSTIPYGQIKIDSLAMDIEYYYTPQTCVSLDINIKTGNNHAKQQSNALEPVGDCFSLLVKFRLT